MSAPDSRCQPEGAHTPAPWRIFTNPDGTKLIGIGDKDGQGILDAGFGVWSWNDPEGIANAELIVKAVNCHEHLVKALQQIVAGSKNADIGNSEFRLKALQTAQGALGVGGVGKP